MGQKYKKKLLVDLFEFSGEFQLIFFFSLRAFESKTVILKLCAASQECLRTTDSKRLKTVLPQKQLTEYYSNFQFKMF